MLRYIFLTFAIYILHFQICTADNQLPIPIDNRMKTLIYSPNEVFRLKFKVGYQSHIVFPKDENPILQSFGDSRGWSIKLVGNSLFIKPMDPGLQTNMIIETNKDRIYYFEILSTFNEDNSDDDFAYRINFYYPEKMLDAPNISKNKGTITGKLPIPNDARNEIDNVGFNFKYSFSGVSNDIKPLKVYDDGNITYMLFANDNEKIPMIYALDDKKEHLLQYKLKDGFIVLDTTEYKFALRLGKDVVYVYNDKFIKK